MNRRRVMNPWESPSRVSADSGTLDVPTRIGSITQPERRRHVFDDPFGDPFGDPFVGVSPRSSGPVRPLDTQPQPITPPAAIMTPSTDVTALSGITRDSTGVFHGPPPPDDEPIVADSEPPGRGVYYDSTTPLGASNLLQYGLGPSDYDSRLREILRRSQGGML